MCLTKIFSKFCINKVSTFVSNCKKLQKTVKNPRKNKILTPLLKCMVGCYFLAKIVRKIVNYHKFELKFIEMGRKSEIFKNFDLKSWNLENILNIFGQKNFCNNLQQILFVCLRRPNIGLNSCQVWTPANPGILTESLLNISRTCFLSMPNFSKPFFQERAWTTFGAFYLPS